MTIQTGHQTFDSQSDYIGTGNVIANTQYSGCIRERTRTECNNFRFEKGHLRNYDLKRFENLPDEVSKKVIELSEDMPVILYKFRHFNGSQEIVHGYVITTQLIFDRGVSTRHLLAYFVTGPTSKSHQVINTMIKLVSDADSCH
jgi:hypothetical protein